MTPDAIKTRLRNLKLEAAQLRATLRRLEPKARKPKVRKVRASEDLERARAYVAMLDETSFCWACGRTRDDRPSWWASPFWGLERMHFVHSGTGRRIKDRRLVILGCSGCHCHYHRNIAEWELPRLTDGQCVLLKSRFDLEWYDPLFIAANNIRGAIEPEKLPIDFRQSFVRFQR